MHSTEKKAWSLEDIIRDRLDKFFNWLPTRSVDEQLPENKEVRQALTRHASNDTTLSTADYKDITNELQKQIALLEKNNAAKKEEIKFLEKEAFTDPATGHLNKNAFHAALRNIVEARLDGIDDKHEPVTVVVLDLNYLKPLNNVSYHGCGDKAIEYLTDFVEKRTKHGDLFTRLSNGDEFGIIMKNCTQEQARARLKPILMEMSEASVESKDNFIKRMSEKSIKEGKKCKDEYKPCIGENNKGEKANIQVSAAFGCTQLPENFPEGMRSSGDRNTDIEDIIKKTLKLAGEEEKKNKMSSKKYAASVAGGFPACDDRENAEKVIGEFLEKRFKHNYIVEKIKKIREEHGTGLKVKPHNPILSKDSRLAGILSRERSKDSSRER